MNEKNLEDKVREAAKAGKNRFGLCDACVHRMRYVCEFRPWRDLRYVTEIVSCPALEREK